MGSATEKLNFHFILINSPLNINSHTWLVAEILVPTYWTEV